MRDATVRKISSPDGELEADGDDANLLKLPKVKKKFPAKRGGTK
jgi:hypothetical protein